MPSQPSIPSDIAFTDTVKGIQSRLGSRAGYARMEQGPGWQTTITDDLAAFIAQQDSVYLATVNADGQPYIQHRGGPKGFLRVLDERTLGFADYRGNRQYISMGNLQDNPKIRLFMMDYVYRQRIKLWGEAEVREDDPDLVAQLMPKGYAARPQRAFLIHVTAWDANCPQHIPQRFDAQDVAAAVELRDQHIAALEADLARIRGGAEAPR